MSSLKRERREASTATGCWTGRGTKEVPRLALFCEFGGASLVGPWLAMVSPFGGVMSLESGPLLVRTAAVLSMFILLLSAHPHFPCAFSCQESFSRGHLSTVRWCGLALENMSWSLYLLINIYVFDYIYFGFGFGLWNLPSSAQELFLALILGVSPVMFRGPKIVPGM